jgi:hypothetical protein
MALTTLKLLLFQMNCLQGSPPEFSFGITGNRRFFGGGLQVQKHDIRFTQTD